MAMVVFCIGARAFHVGRQIEIERHLRLSAGGRRIRSPCSNGNAQNTSVPGMSGEPTRVHRHDRADGETIIGDSRRAAQSALVDACDGAIACARIAEREI